MKGRSTTPHTGKALLAETWVYRAGAERFSVHSIRCVSYPASPVSQNKAVEAGQAKNATCCYVTSCHQNVCTMECLLLGFSGGS